MFKTMCSSLFRKKLPIIVAIVWILLVFALGVVTVVVAIRAGMFNSISSLLALTEVSMSIGTAAGCLFLPLMAFLLILFFRKGNGGLRRFHKTETRLLNAYYYQISVLIVFVASLGYLTIGRSVSVAFFPVTATSIIRYLNNHFLGNFAGLVVSFPVAMVFHLRCPYLKPDAKRKGILPIVAFFFLLLFAGSLIPTIGDRIILTITDYNYQIILFSSVFFLTWLIVLVSVVFLEIPLFFAFMGIVPLSRKEQAAFGEKLKDLRDQFGMSQVELANLLFISPSLISKYENGKNLPGKDTLDRMAKIFDVPIETLDSELEDKAVEEKPEEGNFEP